ncbi:MAG: APC family permease [Myxococcales bacterium]|nr:APC family permease [Myxococcales bacterium]
MSDDPKPGGGSGAGNGGSGGGDDGGGSSGSGSKRGASRHDKARIKQREIVEQRWEFAGWGTAERVTDLADKDVTLDPIDSHAQRHQLGQWSATAICGNDITSSCLYVSALCGAQAGRYAPLALLLVAAVLYLFRKVYAEVGTALPLNGGAYNVLLNTTTKGKASVAACLTLLSYIATAVISAYEAMEYAHHLWHGLPLIGATVGLLFLFAVLNLIGISESAVVALGIFIFHMATLVVLVLFCTVHVIGDSTLFSANWAQEPPGGLTKALFYGFSAAMLGISGFESSANFIEEQKEGVFPQTLRNMWIAVAFFNPVISLLSLGVVPVGDFKNINSLLALMGDKVAGAWLRTWVSIDAVLVLSGAVLTSYVGVTGLVRRMALDRCLPQKLLVENRFRKTNHYIILGFFFLCWSILAITGGNVKLLAGVYTISFLGVMALFAIGNMLLKIERSRLPRSEKASWPAVSIGLVAVLCGLTGNILTDPKNVRVFGVYFLVALLVVGVMFLRIRLLKAVLYITQAASRNIDRITSLNVIYFTKGDDLSLLNRAAQYVIDNEQTRQLKVVHLYREESEIPPELAQHLRTLDRVYPQLRIDFVAVKGSFSPEMIEKISKRFNVPKNYMFIGTPGDRFPHNIADLGGVRVIL